MLGCSQETNRSQIFGGTLTKVVVLKETDRSYKHSMNWGSRSMPKGQKTRERIVAEAASLFNQRGFEGSSMSELMEATGLEKGGIYRHFSSKEELAAKAFDYAWKLALDTRMHDVERIPNSVDKLKQFIANFID